MALMLLTAAILCEVAATLPLRASDGFTQHHFTVLVAIAYVGAFTLLSLARPVDLLRLQEGVDGAGRKVSHML